jgi:GTP cyclohydrolase I
MDLENIFKNLLVSLGENVDREGLLKTPKRASDAYRFLTHGYSQNIDQIINEAIFTASSNDMIVVKNIELYSLCEHHLLPFIGKCHVAYIPEKHILGLSKVSRIVDVFARRLQTQEVLTKQIADCMMTYTKARGVGVVIEAQHLCMMMRGVEKQNSSMITSCLLGEFLDLSSTRNEFMNLISKI